MPDFLLEIGCEEIPARMLDDAREELSRRVKDLIVREALVLEEGLVIESFSTPRRLSTVVRKIASTQADTTEQVLGPSVKIAYKDGKPTPAAEAFAKKVGLDVSKLEKVSNPKGEYLAATITRKGRGAVDVLSEFLPKEIASIYWPKSMYWRPGKTERFVRPIRWIVAVLGGQVVPVEFAGIKAGETTHGHRILAHGPLKVSDAAQYTVLLEGASVIADSKVREHRIRKALDAETRSVSGARWREDADLLQTVVNLTEWPSVVLGSFDRQFLSLPEEVLVTVMRDHQKYFAVEDASGKLAPHFLAVLNMDADADGLIRHGNERVLRARFNDARFFWDTDQKLPLVGRVEMLRAVTFQKDLGSYFAKAERLVHLSGELSPILDSVGRKVDHAAVAEAARLAKTDLTTELVKEFTELQGIVGGLYATAQKHSQAVADAIYDQYRPESMDDAIPRTLEGALLSIADKADTIAGMFAMGLVPSGSKDPFALRRQANGIVRTVAGHKLPLKISMLMGQALKGYAGGDAIKKFSQQGEAYAKAIQGFFRERLEFFLREQGLAYDVVNAALAAGDDDIVDVVARAHAVAAVRPSADFESISTSFKRMKNILLQASETKKRVADPYDPASLKEEAEKNLAAQAPEVASLVKSLGAKKEYENALREISRLRPPIDAFFDKVMVMVEEEDLRATRLGLLQMLVNDFSSIADFSEIVTEKK
ncbi:MAG TPA: glycine--tRNA ligase subunit beta [Candidatus Angelobacter sp.]|nr:glycine--tRNA ligase subunit beta [Candidatus Angelobacter sp.]